MIGNDLIALSGWPARLPRRRERYRRKVFSSAEQALLEGAGIPSWLQDPVGWSLKEAAYKAHYRSNRQRSFAPRRLVIELLCLKDHASWEGVVSSQDQAFLLRCEHVQGMLHALARAPNAKPPVWQRQKARPVKFNHRGRSFRFCKDDDDLPVVIEETSGFQYPASLSHDGGQHAWSWQPNGPV